MMLFESSLFRSFWGYVILYTAHILNRIINWDTNWGMSTEKIPYYLYTVFRPFVVYLRSFECGAQILLTGMKNKLASCSVWGVFISLSENKKAYIVHAPFPILKKMMRRWMLLLMLGLISKCLRTMDLRF